MTTYRNTFLAAGVLAAAAFSAPAIAADAVNIGALRFTSHSPTFIAVEKGYFKAEGIDAKIKFFQAAQPIAVAIASGDIDLERRAESHRWTVCREEGRQRHGRNGLQQGVL
jgi:NitT/TauT family transport system substrate-binding protein